MKITFNDTKTVSYDVESIADITFTESGDDPVTPPATSDKVLVTQISDGNGGAIYTYDAQDRCTSMYIDGFINLEFNYETMTIELMGYSVGTFTLTPQGYFSSQKIDFMGFKYEFIMDYDSNGHLSHGTEKALDEDGYYETKLDIFWENNLLVKVVGEVIEEIEGTTEVYPGVYTVTYSQQENKANQWTLAMIGEEGLAFQCISGMYGKAPVCLPNAIRWDEDSASDSVSYTFNSDGSINTETIGNDVYRYYYGGRSASPAKKNFRGFMRKLSRKIAEQ